ncbi:MAG: HRDC domain-containing protein, partial [Smithellaceae bacterium]|nr:HRDC domain-containing protein [Smithellaceae bacterium]
KVQGYKSLSQKQKEFFRKLYFWRFLRAKEENRAVFMFLPDKTMLELAQNPHNLHECLKPEKLERYGTKLKEIIKKYSA